MKYTHVFIVILFMSPLHLIAAKSEKNQPIESALQFQRWCKSLSYRHFRQKKQTPYNWSASTIRQLNDYRTSGNWKVDNVAIHVFCQIRIGKKAKYTKIQTH